MQTGKVELFNNHFTLYPQKGIFWEEEKALLISDVHIGKAAQFRHRGIPVPAGTSTEDLNKISQLINLTAAKKLIVLGDLLHSSIENLDKTLNEVKLWRVENASLNISLIKGNHDTGNDSFFERLNVDIIPHQLERNQFIFAHHPEDVKDKFVFAGHIHPAVMIKGKGNLRERHQCFYFSENFAVLPSFGSFTGNFLIKPKDFEKVFVIAEDEVIEIENY